MQDGTSLPGHEVSEEHTPAGLIFPRGQGLSPLPALSSLGAREPLRCEQGDALVSCLSYLGAGDSAIQTQTRILRDTKTIPLFSFSFFFFNLILLFFWLCRIFVAACGLSLVEGSAGYSLLRCVGFSLRWLQ